MKIQRPKIESIFKRLKKAVSFVFSFHSSAPSLIVAMVIAETILPPRFLSLITQIIITMNLFWFQDQTVRASLPLGGSTDETKSAKETEVLVALSLGISINALELISLFIGYTIFSHGTGMFSTACHVAGSITLAFVLLESLSVTTLWYSFALTCVLPGLVELTTVIVIARIQGGR